MVDEVVTHELLAVTLKFPETLVTVAEIELLVEEPIQPPGKLQLYALAPGIAATLNVLLAFGHKVLGPTILAGACIILGMIFPEVTPPVPIQLDVEPVKAKLFNVPFELLLAELNSVVCPGFIKPTAP